LDELKARLAKRAQSDDGGALVKSLRGIRAKTVWRILTKKSPRYGGFVYATRHHTSGNVSLPCRFAGAPQWRNAGTGRKYAR
ncbi:hypothetical protein, partial [Klebsiella pneumoniae]